jgi:hypothetical protein
MIIPLKNLIIKASGGIVYTFIKVKGISERMYYFKL